MSNLIEKFGKDGIKGSLGEIWFYNHLLETYDQVIDYRDDSIWQMFGIDFAIKKEKWSRYFLLDVKTNLRSDGTFFLEVDGGRGCRKMGWFLASKADRIVHLNVEEEKFLWYDLPEMREYMLFHKDKISLSKDKKVIILNENDFSRNLKILNIIENA